MLVVKKATKDQMVQMAIKVPMVCQDQLAPLALEDLRDILDIQDNRAPKGIKASWVPQV
jgi:hypothetical protein